MTWIKDHILSPIGALIRRIYCGMLDLTDRQQRALMTWGMLGGIVALEIFAWWALGRVDSYYPEDAAGPIALEIVATYREALRWILILVGVLAGGMVTIARGGETTIKMPGVEVTARGKAAHELAKRDVPAPAPPVVGPPQ